MRRKSLVLVASLGIVTAALATSANATVVAPWVELNTEDVSGITQAGLARTADGVLHVVWVQESPTDDEVMHTTIAPDGTVAAPNFVVDGFGFLDATAELIVTNTGSLRAFFGGSRPSAAGGLWTSESTDGGATWTPEALVENETFWGGSMAAEQDAAGTFYEVTGNLLHVGLDTSGPNSTFGAGMGTSCCFWSRLGEDLASGELWNAFFAQGDFDGLYAQQVTPGTGAPTGGTLHMPGSSIEYNGDPITWLPVFRVPLTERVGGGIYVSMKGYSSYPGNLDRVLVWKIGDASSYTVAKTTGSDDAVGLAAAPDGRLWSFWADQGYVYASISNGTVTAWSPPKKLKVFAGDEFGEIYLMLGDATASHVDIVATLAQVNLNGLYHASVPTPPEWTAGDDTIAGTSAADYIYGGPGNDKLSGAGGKDELYGGNGDDKLNGGPGKDKLSGGKGVDTCIFTKGDKMSGCEKKKRAH